MSFTKSDMVDHVSQETGLTKKDTRYAIDVMLDFIITANAANEKVKLSGFGSFEPRKRAGHKGIDPNTKKPLFVPSTMIPKFTAGKEYKEKIKALLDK